MFNHFTFTQRPSTSDVHPKTTTATSNKEADTTNIIASSSIPNIVESSVPLPPPDIDIIGHKLSFLNVPSEQSETIQHNEEDLVSLATTPTVVLEQNDNQELFESLNQLMTKENESPISNIHNVDDDIDDDDDNFDDDLLSVQLDDLSGSILDNIPSSPSRNNDDTNTIESVEGTNTNPVTKLNQDVDDPTNTSLFFQPVVQALQQQQQQSILFQNQDHDDDSLDEEILSLAPTLRRLMQTNVHANNNILNQTVLSKVPSVSNLNNIKAEDKVYKESESYPFLPRQLIWTIYLILIMGCMMWLSTMIFIDTTTINGGTKNGILNKLSDSKTEQGYAEQQLSTPVATPIIELHNGDDHGIQTDTQHDVDEGNTILSDLLNAMKFDSWFLPLKSPSTVSVGDILSVTEFIENMSSTKATLATNANSWWLPKCVKRFHAMVQLVRSIYNFLASAVYMTTIIVSIGVVIKLFANCLSMVSNDDHTIADIQENRAMPKKSRRISATTVAAKKATASISKDNKLNQKMMTNRPYITSKMVCKFIRDTAPQLQRTGYRSRIGVSSSDNLDMYDKTNYDMLSIGDLKVIGTFLQVPNLSTYKRKINLISAVMAQFETLLQSYNNSEIKEVLDVQNVEYDILSNRNDMMKLAIESGF